MALAPKVKTGNIVDKLYDDLRNKILAGELAPGMRLSAERELAQQYGTNRNTLREAIRKLEHARLVSVRHGQGVTVCDFRKSSTIEMIGPFLAVATDPDESLRMLLDLLAARLHILELAVSLAARRADEKDVARLKQMAQTQLAAFEAKDRAALARIELDFLDALVDTAHSLAVRWVANTLLEVYRQLAEPIAELWVIEPSFPDYLNGLLEAFAKHDADAALKVTHDYYTRSDKTLLDLLELPQEHADALRGK